MVISGSFRSRAELRKRPRRHFQYAAHILTDGGNQPRPCSIADISHTGAQLVLEDELELPNRFILLLTGNGVARRKCRLVWRTESTVGVEFIGVRP